LKRTLANFRDRP